jgi:hypothetical protein
VRIVSGPIKDFRTRIDDRFIDFSLLLRERIDLGCINIRKITPIRSFETERRLLHIVATVVVRHVEVSPKVVTFGVSQGVAINASVAIRLLHFPMRNAKNVVGILIRNIKAIGATVPVGPVAIVVVFRHLGYPHHTTRALAIGTNRVP